METAIAIHQSSSSLTLNTALSGFREQLQIAAQQNLDAFLEGSDEGYTEMEKRAMMVVEELRLLNGLDLATIYMRGDLVRQIRTEALHTVHPERYGSLEELAKDQGISASELSQTMSLVDVIFPWMEEHGMSVAQVWEEVGKSNFREMTPALVALITGEDPARASTRSAVDALLNDVAATNVASGVEMDEDELADAAAELLMEAGGQMTNRALRTHLRPDRTEPIELTVIRTNGRRMVVANIDEDQWVMLQNKLGRYMEEISLTLPDDPRRRALEASRSRTIREIASLLVQE